MSEALEKEAADRLRDARAQKAQWDIDIREAYYFTAPQRSRDVTSQTQRAETRPRDAGTLNTSLGMEVGQDFATEMLNTFMPQSLRWCEQKPGTDLSGDAWEELKDKVDKQTGGIFDGIKASNFYPAAAQAFMPDLGIGTTAMIIDDVRAHEPIVCQPIPARELEINVGPYGQVDDRFIVRPTRYRHLDALLPRVDLPKAVADRKRAKPNERCTVTWGFWRLWDRPDVVWQAVVLVDKHEVWSRELNGVGACPLIVGRFDPDPMFAWGTGPTIKALPEFRHLDVIRGLHIQSADFRVRPPFIYQDDGILNFSGGLNPGDGYVARQWGAGEPIHVFDVGGEVNFAHFELNQIEQGIRRMHFVDFPEQVGKTPPTAEQWLDQLQRTKKRIGTPGTIFWREFPVEVFQRFKFLLEQRGAIEALPLGGKKLSLVPFDPTEVAQKQQDVMVADRFLTMAGQHFPQISQVVIDAIETLKNMKDGLQDKLVVIREPEEIQGAIDQFGKLAAGSDPSAAGGGPSPDAAPGMAPPPNPGSPSIPEPPPGETGARGFPAPAGGPTGRPQR